MSQKKMLVVDDSLFNRQVLSELFDVEFEVLQAGDGVEAMTVMRQHASSLSVILLDIVMPNKDGISVLREMQKDPRLKSIPVIVTSAAGDDVFRLKALELGAVDYIQTPFNPMLAKLRVKSTLATREYDRLRLQNEILRMQAKGDADYHAVLEDTHTAILEFDGQGRILRYDATIKNEMAGTYDDRQLIDIFRDDHVAEPEALEALRQLFDSMITGSEAVSDHLDMLLRMRNGVRSWFRLRLIKKVDDDDTRLVMAIHNVDQQKREEEATRSQLIHALNAAESVGAAKDEFMARMSHEIRTPLNAIIGFINLCHNCLNDSERMEEYLTKAEFASKHLLSIINDVLDISAIESGRMTINYESYNLRELINSVTSIIYPLVHKKNLLFQIKLESVTEETVMGDQMRVSQILLNLLSNAVKFTPQNGSVSLIIRQQPTNASRILMEFVVTDNGIGMSREFLERLGRPFEQQNAAIARQYGGSGLGLSITKNLVALMNGAMTIHSVEGRGSTFTVSLPVDIESVDPGTHKPYHFANVHALVVDRDKAAGEHTRACFRSMGCRCDCVTSGREAIDLYQSNNYNLVLMDWKLPDIDGRSLVDAVRQAADGEPKIVVMAYDPSEFSKDAGPGLRFINKPIFPSSVLDLLLLLYGEYPVKTDDLILSDFHGKRVLLAEDNTMNMEIASNILEKMGFTVVPVMNGQEACEAFEASQPGEYDVILMDVQMPVMDGYEATRRIRLSQHPSAGKIPILAMTANVFTQDVADALECGMNGHIAKPIDIDQLRQTLARHVLGEPRGQGGN